MRVGLAVVASPRAARRPGGAGSTPRSRSARPWACAPRPVAPSSRISPPEPVAAPGNGEIAVGWLCVSTFIRMCDRLVVRAVDAGRRVGEEARRRACPRSPRRCRLYADSTPPGLRLGACAGSSRTATAAAAAPSMIQLGVEDLVAAVLAVRLREHHQLDVGRVAAQRAVARRPGSRSRRATAPGPASRSRARATARPPARQRRRAPAGAAPRARTASRRRRRASSTDSVMRSWSARRSAASSTTSPTTT